MTHIVNFRSISLRHFCFLCAFLPCILLGSSLSPKWHQDFATTLQNTKSQSCIDITHKTQDALAQKVCLSMPFESLLVEDDMLKVQTFSRDEDDKNFYTSIFLSFKLFENTFYLYEYGVEGGYDNGSVRQINTTKYYYDYDEQSNANKQPIPLVSLNDEILESLEECWNLHRRQCHLDDALLESLKK